MSFSGYVCSHFPLHGLSLLPRQTDEPCKRRHSFAGVHQQLSKTYPVQRSVCLKLGLGSNRSFFRSLQLPRRSSIMFRQEDAITDVEEVKEENVSKATLIWRAIKLPIYTVALVPTTVASAAAYFQTGQFFAQRYYTLLISSFLVIAWLNLSNDVYDFDAGADKNKKESIVNLVGSRRTTLVIAWILLVLGFAGLTRVSLEATNIRPVFLLAYSIICGYVYQCPPFRLSYLGLGEPLCFVAFGPFATTAFYLLLTGTRELAIPGTVVASSILVGFTTSLILFCSHFHQIEDDKSVAKFSPLVRIGSEIGAKAVKVAVITLYSLLFALWLGQTLPFSSIVLCAFTLPIGKKVISFVESNHKDKAKIFMAKYYCVRLHTLFGASLAVGLFAARLFARRKLPHAVIL